MKIKNSQPNAADKYLAARTEIRTLMSEITKKLAKHEDNFDGKNYGYVGDLNYIASELRNLNNFLKP